MGEIGDAPHWIDGDFSPRVHAADVLPRVRRPRVVTELARMRNRVKLPRELAGDDVVRANISCGRHVVLAGRRAEDDQVFENLARIGRLCLHDRGGVAAKALSQIHGAVGAERENRLPRTRVNRLKITVLLKQQPPISAIAALPVVDASRRDALQGPRGSRFHGPCLHRARRASCSVRGRRRRCQPRRG